MMYMLSIQIEGLNESVVITFGMKNMKYNSGISVNEKIIGQKCRSYKRE